MITYLIKSGLCLTLVLFIYKVLLERERMYMFNRYYLLFGLCFAFIVPFIPIVSSVAVPLVENNSAVLIENAENLPMTSLQQEVSNPISWTLYIIGLYAIGCLFFFSRFTSNIYKIFQKITKNTKAFYKKASLVLLHENVLPHTFLNYIFLEKEAYDTKNIADELYTHELAHVSQKHTLDIILIELIQIIFWFNPLLIYYKKAIQLNHEFLADDAVLKSNTKIPAYQQLLLENASWNHNLYLASNLNFSVTKKRLQMMTKQTSRIRAWLIASLTIPIFIGALFLFSTKVVAQETTAELVETTASQSTIPPHGKVSYFKNATFIFEDEKGNKTTKTYAELTNEEKARLIPPPKTPVAKRPTAKLLNNWKNKKEFAIWLDGKVIANDQISNYDIVHYTGSFVHKNARSKRFPQNNQIRLYTKSGFKNLELELTKPLSKNAVIHIKKGSNQVRLSKKKTASETEVPTKNKSVQNQNRKDIELLINKDEKFLLNEDYVCKLNSLDKFIKLELAKILHKKARTASIRYDKTVSKDFVNKAVAILKSNKIYDITIQNSNSEEEIRLPPPPPMPPPPPAPAPVLSEQEKKDMERMHKNIKGHELKTMMINGKKYYYIIKNDYKYIYNEKSQLVDENGERLPPPPPPPKQKKKG